MKPTTLLWTLTCLAVAASAAAQDSISIQAQPSVIVTSGDGSVRRTPDRAFVTIAVEAYSKNPRDAQRQNADAMAGVQQRLAQARLPKDAIRTLGYTLELQYEIVQNARLPRDYAARNAVEVRLDDVTKVGDVIDSVVRGGATSVSALRFDVQDRSTMEREALRLAVADARARAEAAAAGAGLTLDRVLRIEDERESGGVPRPVMLAKAMEATDIEPGLIEVKAHVTLTVAVK
jgi:uncharacterized protein YggE